MSSSAKLIDSLITQALKTSSFPAIRNLRVEESDEEVVLVGCVGSWYFKQLAQETVMPVLGPRRLVNRVTVVPS